MKTVLLTLLIIALRTQAQEGALGKITPQAGIRNDNTKYDLNVNTAATVDPTVLGGTCLYKDNWCPGARVTLKNSKNEVLQSALVNRDGFKFGNLLPGYYNLQIEFKKEEISATIPGVASGQMVKISFDEPKK